MRTLASRRSHSRVCGSFANHSLYKCVLATKPLPTKFARRGFTLPVINQRRGFTLIELLVVAGILLTLASIVIVAFGANVGPDRLRSAVRQFQSAFLSAQNRAQAAGAARSGQSGNERGIRLVFDDTDSSASAAPESVLIGRMAFIQPVPPLLFGRSVAPGSLVQLEREVASTSVTSEYEVRYVRATGATVAWGPWIQAGLMPNPGRIRIPAGSKGRWYQYYFRPGTGPTGLFLPDWGGYAPGAPPTSSITPGIQFPFLPGGAVADGRTSTSFLESANSDPAFTGSGITGSAYGSYMLQLTQPFHVSNSDLRRTAFPDDSVVDGVGMSCEIDLGNQLLPNQSPFTLPPNTVIHLNQSSSHLVRQWLPVVNIVAGVEVRPSMDILYTSRGRVAGSMAAAGPMYFLITQESEALDSRAALLPLGLYNDMSAAAGLRVSYGGSIADRVTSTDYLGNPWVRASVDPAGRWPKISNDRYILAVYPQTGAVQSFPLDETDVVSNAPVPGPPAPGADGFCDDPYRFARRGILAGK